MEPVPVEKLGINDPIPHYYGDFVRTCLILGGIIMLLTLPFFQNEIPFPIYIPIGLILIVNVSAALTNPRNIWLASFNTFSALIGFLVFEYFAVTRFNQSPNYFAIINQILALIFFTASYYSIKTLRWFFIRKSG